MANVTELVQRGLKQQIDAIVEEEVKLAVASAVLSANNAISKRVRELATSVAANVLQKFDMECFGNKLVIKVDFSEGGEHA